MLLIGDIKLHSNSTNKWK